MIRAAARALAAAAAAFAAACAHAAIDADAAFAASRGAIGSQPANAAFTEASGRRVSLADFRGRPLVVSFAYTGCSQVCPTTTRFLAKAVREARGVVGTDAFGVATIGFNVPADNPLSMRVFGRQQGIDGDPRWALLVPDPAAVEGLARDFGFSYRPQAGGFDHLAQVTILDAEGRIRAQVYGERFDVAMLVRPLRELALGEPVSTGSLAQVLERVRLICTVYDPLTGGYRLDWRLFIELAVGLSCLGLTLAWVIRERRRARHT